MIIDEKIPRWKHPTSYGGHSPEGDYVAVVQNRDSDSVERSNYERIYADLLKKAIELGQPEGLDRDPSDNPKQYVYSFRTGHWAVGWVEYVIVKQISPDALVIQLAEIVGNLADYPVYDEDHLSSLEYNEAAEYWAELDVKERLAVIKDSHAQISCFAARRSELPDNDHVFDWVRRS